ncbi:MAG: WD40/YVTN/BNR-like repeat-containing protein [Pyrinomonadaceae bacterium]
MRKTEFRNWRCDFASLRLCVGILFFSTLASAQWVKQTVNTTVSFRGLSVVNEKIVWASGTGGTVIRTVDGGKSWKVMTVLGGEKLDFRDIEAFDANTAYILSIGNGELSRIYKTTDGGKTWILEFKNGDEKAFFDAIDCWDVEHCITMSDPVDNRYVLLRRSPGRTSYISVRDALWSPLIYPDNNPLAIEGEAAFAASGTCLITHGKNFAFLVSGGNGARVFRSDDRGLTWTVAETPIIRGSPGSGIFSVAFRNALHGVLVGGNYEKPTESKMNLAFTGDGGKTWHDGEGLTGYRSAVTYIDDKTIIAVGTNGTDVTKDGGKTWKKIGDEDLNAVAAKGKRAVWAVGPKGLVTKLKM